MLIWNCWIRLQRLNQQKHEMGQMPFSTSRRFKQKWKRFNQNNKNSAEFKSRTEQFEFCLVWDVWERPVEKTFNQKKLWDRFNQSNFQFWLDWDVWEEPAEKIQPKKTIQWLDVQCWFCRKDSTILNLNWAFWILIGFGCLGGAGRKDSTKKKSMAKLGSSFSMLIRSY